MCGFAPFHVLFALFLGAIGYAAPEFVSKDPTLAALAPGEAFESVGCWQIGDRFVATGHSIFITVLGNAKDKRTELEIAEADTRSRILQEVARKQVPDFDADSYQLTGEMINFQTAAAFRIPGRDGLFLIGIVESKSVKVSAVFDMATARKNALLTFNAGDFSHAARLFASLTQRGAQDAETVAMGNAASAHLNLTAGITGPARSKALQLLSDFYFKREDDKLALDFGYALYQETKDPERVLLERLVELCKRTHRQSNASAFLKEIALRWPEPKKQ